MVKTACRIALGLALLSGSASASDLKTSLYDAQGRLIATTHVTQGPGSYVGYVFDDADNRTQRAAQFSPLPAAQNILASNETMVPVQSLVSADGRMTFRLQADGNLVVRFGGAPLWNSGTNTGQSMLLGMQGDGNLVLYNSSFQALWTSGTAGNPGAILAMQHDGNLVIYSSGGTPIWASNTGGN